MRMPQSIRRLARSARFLPLAAVLCTSCAAEDEANEDMPVDTPAATETVAPPAPQPADTTVADTVRPSDSAQVGDTATAMARDTVRVESPPIDVGEAQDAASILRRAAAAYQDVRAMRATFTMAVENPLLRTTTNSRGTLYQKSPDRIKLEFEDPAGDLIVGDGTHFWVYYPSVDANQVIRMPAGDAGASGSVDLRAQFVGDPVTRFEHTLEGTERVAGRETHVLTLVPRQDMGYRQLKVWIDRQDGLSRKFDIVEHSGLTRRLQLSSLEINPALGDAVFRFTPPPGARIVER